MSYVTSVVVVTAYASKALEDAITKPYAFERDEQVHLDRLRALDMSEAGGSKSCGSDVFAAGLNFADRGRLRAFMDALPWSDVAVVMVHTEGDMCEVWTYGEGSAE